MSDSLRIATYALLATVALVRARKVARSDARALVCVGVLAAGLALAIFLDAAGTLAQVGRGIARDEGWYQERRTVQAIAIVLLAATAAVAGVGVLAMSRTGSLLIRSVVAGSACLLAFLAARTISLHRVDALVIPEAGLGLRRGDLVEIALVLALTLLVWKVPASRRGESHVR